MLSWKQTAEKQQNLATFCYNYCCINRTALNWEQTENPENKILNFYWQQMEIQAR